MIDLSRKNFEEYYNDLGGFCCQYCLHHRMGDSYNIPDIAKAWRHWQASRECLVIEMPPEPECPEDPDEAIDDSHMDAYHSAIRMRSACRNSIRAAGVKTK